jgi:DNA-binding NtrC family response regulator
MDALLLLFRDEPLRQFSLGSRPLEIGSDPRCDIVVHDPEVPRRKLLVMRDQARVVAYDVSSPSRGPERALHLGIPIPVGRNHAVVRTASVEGARAGRGTPRTDIIAPERLASGGFALVVGEGPDARRLAVGRRPVFVGTEPGNDIVLSDRTVSGRHLRLDPEPDGLVVRDLGSRNGTWVDGVKVDIARVSTGARIRAGRTNLVVVSRRTEVPNEGSLVAASRQMEMLLVEVDRLARLGWPVLVSGPSGAGKEGVARALHDRSARARGPFVALNAGGLPSELVESELFGHEKGAFTGAAALRRGVFEQADKGTLFLDEIGELPLELQARLLRVLETWQVRRVGGESTIPVDVRLVCATHRDLRAMVVKGEFREDLYYRLARLVVAVPPLAERPEDIEALAVHFLRQIRDDVGHKRLSDDALAQLLAHPWPGNARELRNVVCAAAAATPSATIQSIDIERALERVAGPSFVGLASAESLLGIMAQHGNNLSAAARALGVPRTTLRDRLKGVSKTRERRAVRELRAVGAHDGDGE